MAVVEASKMEKSDGGSPGTGWLPDALGWLPRKLGELKTFFSEVKGELKKVTWPSWDEVKSTTIVVILTTFFFGFYLYFLDIAFSRLQALLFRTLR